MANIIVTGGAGFIGTNLIKQLLNDGSDIQSGYKRHKIVSLDNYSIGTKENHQDGCIYYNIDIASTPNFSFFMTKPDFIYHLGARARIAPSFDDPISYFDSNVKGTRNIMEFARQTGAKVLYAGSSSFHGGVYANPYTFTKWLGEEICTMYNQVYNVNINICRFYNVYGPYSIVGGPYSTVIGIYQKAYKENQPLLITGDGEQRRDFTHVEDVVGGLIKAAYSETTGKIFELGRGRNYSINELANMFNGECEIKYIPPRKGEIRETLCRAFVAEDELGWKPKYNLEDYIAEWLNENIRPT